LLKFVSSKGTGVNVGDLGHEKEQAKQTRAHLVGERKRARDGSLELVRPGII